MSNINATQETIYALAAVNDALFAARPTGVYRSADGGQMWHNTFESNPELHGIAATALAVRDDLLLAGVNGGIAISSDDGESWQVRSLGAPPPLVVDITMMDEHILAATADDGVFISDDGGTTWAGWNFGLIDMRVNALAAASESMVYAGTESGIFRSHNGGRSWREIAFPMDSAPVLSLAFTADYVFAGTQSAGLLYAGYAGDNWSSVPGLDALAHEVVHALLPDADNLLILTDQQLIRLAADDLSHNVLKHFPAREALTMTCTPQQIVIGFADGGVETVPRFPI